MLAGLFNSAGSIMMFLLAPETANLEVSTFFAFYSYYSIVVLLVVLVVYPAVPYTPNEPVRFCSYWARADVKDAGDSPDSIEHNTAEVRYIEPDKDNTEDPTAPAFYELTLPLAVKKPRFIWFCLSFGWSTCIAVVIGGQFNIIAVCIAAAVNASSR